MPTRESNDFEIAVQKELAKGYGVEDIALALSVSVGRIRGVIVDLRRTGRLPVLYRNARRMVRE